MPELNKEISQAIQAQRQALAETIVERQYREHPTLRQRFDEEERPKRIQEVNDLLSFLAEAITMDDPSLFVDYVDWAETLFEGLDYPDETITTALEYTQQALQEILPPEMTLITHKYVEAGLKQLRETSKTEPSFAPPDGPLGELAQNYFEALLAGERHKASQLILEAVDDSTGVKEVYLNVFQPTQYEIGRLWQLNQMTVAQEHYFTAATQLIMSQLYPHIFSTEKVGWKLVATCVGGELHEIGVRMVADFFEIEGWDTYYLGANTPADTIVQAIAERQADVLAVSATMSVHVSEVANLIERVRTSKVGQQVKILVGGYPFNRSPDLWQRMGVDGYAQNAQDAVTTANQLVKGKAGSHAED